jgi:predicted nucleic acid-binding protein
MPSACFIDTNLLLYARDQKTPEKAKTAVEWLAVLADSDSIVISPQVLNEYAYNIIRKFRHYGHDRLLADLELMQPWCRAETNCRTALHASRIHHRYRFSFYGCCHVASALEYGCDLFLSEDMSHGQRIAGMQIINPFVSELRTITDLKN